MNQTHALDAVARLPLPDDNLAIAIRRLEAGSTIRHGTAEFQLSHSVLEGHRFAITSIPAGRALRSWTLPFGRALTHIAAGDYICNRAMLEALEGRRVDVTLPDVPNFVDVVEPYHFDDTRFQPGPRVAGPPRAQTFRGYARTGERGVGTRNYVVVLGTSSRTSSFARELAHRCRDLAAPGLDGVVAIAHTEGGGGDRPNNADCLLRALAGFMVHPNVGAVIAVDYGSEAITNRDLEHYLVEQDYPLAHVPHRFMSLTGAFQTHLQDGERQIREWCERVAVERTDESLRHLRLALQCGGSDAFSGISGNPLAAWAAREVIRAGGGANLAETDELIGAEHYVLANVRDANTARRFLAMIERFKTRVAWHGESCEGNPSGGNRFRGLYNIVLKSIGAAMKRHPDVPLDYCIDYGERMNAGGYYFMDSPGNDLESIAGQIAAGCNVIYFVTGNGSITNFPLAPTLKIVTTTPRFHMLSADMDVNAGAYQDGTPMDELGASLFDLTLEVAGGRRSKGELAGHTQVQIWRNWPQNDASRLAELRQKPRPSGTPVTVANEPPPPELTFAALRSERGLTSEHVGLILPTSLCSGQIAELIAERLNAEELGRDKGLSRFVALAHTEGCGVTGANAEALYARSMVGYLTHPLVRCALLLEHGCEKTHNDYMRLQLNERGVDATPFGWASVQQDGGIENVGTQVQSWFRNTLATLPPATVERTGLSSLRVGLAASGPLPVPVAEALGCITRWLVAGGGTVVIPECGPLLESDAYLSPTFPNGRPEASLAHGETAGDAGCFVMETPTEQWAETITGLGAAGVQQILTHAGTHPMQGHPLVPLLQVSATPSVHARYADDLDLPLAPQPKDWSRVLLDQLLAVASRQYAVRAHTHHNTAFQLTRGLLGVSM